MTDDDFREPEYLGPGQPAPRTGWSTGRWAAVGGASVAVLAATGVGAWAVLQLMSTGAAPSAAVPAAAIGYVSVDLDPSASQKINALRTLKKFPAADDLGMGAQDDVLRTLVEQAQDDSTCPDLDYDRDVAPWLGNRFALAVVENRGELVPFGVVQVTDRAAARTGIAALAACGDAAPAPRGAKAPATTPGPAVSFVDDYALVGEDPLVMDMMAAQAEVSSLEDDPEFTSWMAEVGDPGIITAYASAEAPQAASRAMGEAGAGVVAPRLDALYADFTGAAMTVRFGDGTVEAETASGGLPGFLGAPGGESGTVDLASLPETTAFALGVAVPSGWASSYADTMSQALGDDVTPETMWRGAEKATGLSLPEDLDTLLGEGVTFSVDSSLDVSTLDTPRGLSAAPAGLRISGDPEAISRVVEKLRTSLRREVGPDVDRLIVTRDDDGVVLGLSRDYLDILVADGGAGDLDGLESFERVLPEADKASAAVFVNFDAGQGWLDSVLEGADADREVASNLAVLDAVGISSWVEDETAHGLMMLTTD